MDVQGAWFITFNFEELETTKMFKIGQWLNELWYVYSEEYLVAIKKNIEEY